MNEFARDVCKEYLGIEQEMREHMEMMRQYAGKVEMMRKENPFIAGLDYMGTYTGQNGEKYHVWAVEYSDTPLRWFESADCVFITRPVAEDVPTLCEMLSSSRKFSSPENIRELSIYPVMM